MIRNGSIASIAGKLLIVTAIAALAACDWNGSSQPQNLAEYLKQATTDCHLPEGAIRLEGEKTVHFQPPATAKYDDVACALTRLQNSPFPIDLGLISNDAYQEGNRM